MWDIHRRIDLDRLPVERVVARFDFRGIPASYRGARATWLVLQRPEVDVCLTDPGFGTDIVVSADLKAITKVWLGDLRFNEALRSRAIVIEGLNLRDVEPGIYDMLCLPLRVVGADGAPARVLLRRN